MCGCFQVHGLGEPRVLVVGTSALPSSGLSSPTVEASGSMPCSLTEQPFFPELGFEQANEEVRVTCYCGTFVQRLVHDWVEVYGNILCSFCYFSFRVNPAGAIFKWSDPAFDFFLFSSSSSSLASPLTPQTHQLFQRFLLLGWIWGHILRPTRIRSPRSRTKWGSKWAEVFWPHISTSCMPPLNRPPPEAKWNVCCAMRWEGCQGHGLSCSWPWEDSKLSSLSTGRERPCSSEDNGCSALLSPHSLPARLIGQWNTACPQDASSCSALFLRTYHQHNSLPPQLVEDWYPDNLPKNWSLGCHSETCSGQPPTAAVACWLSFGLHIFIHGDSNASEPAQFLLPALLSFSLTVHCHLGGRYHHAFFKCALSSVALTASMFFVSVFYRSVIQTPVFIPFCLFLLFPHVLSIFHTLKCGAVNRLQGFWEIHLPK